MKTSIKLFLLSLFIPIYISAQPIVPKWAYNATIYEVNIRQYTPEGTFNAFEKYLPKLKELGVDILWLMPINPIGEKNRKGTLGSYYSIKDYTEINPEFGTKEDFKNLVDEIHKLGMHIIIDWVANHTAWDHPWVTAHPEYYTKDSLGHFVPPVADWSDVIDLNYDNKNLRAEMIKDMEYWVKDFNIDGFRCDVAGMVPTDFWNKARKELDKIKPVFMLAEWEAPDLHFEAFNMTYSWKVYKAMNNIYSKKQTAKDLENIILEDQKEFPNYAFRMQFTSNHDENSWNRPAPTRLGKAAEMFAAFTYVIPGMPLIYDGQEVGLNKKLKFFDKDLINWKSSKYFDFYKKLNELKKHNNALNSGEEGAPIQFINGNINKGVLAFVRINDDDKVFAIFNMSDKTNKVSFNNDLINGSYLNFRNDEKTEIEKSTTFKLKPWSFKIFYTDDNSCN